MMYPIVTESQCLEFAHAKMRREAYDLETRWVGLGQKLDLGRIEEAASEIRKLVDSAKLHKRSRDQVEGEAALILYEALSGDEEAGCHGVDVAVLDDPGFWRYLSLRWFWDFVEWRQWGTTADFDEGKHLVYVNAVKSSECVLTRMYLRMTALGGSKYGSHASRLRRSTDFWRSHIFRVRSGSAPALVRAMVEFQHENSLKTRELREFAKRINRTWSNVLLNLYTQDEAAELLRKLGADL